MKRGTENLLKFKYLMRDLDLPEYAVTGLLQTLWMKTDINCPCGNIGKFTNADIALIIDWRGDPDELISVLVSRGWLDEHPEHRLIVHDWPTHCEDTTHAKVARSLQYFADGTTPKLINLGKRTNEITKFYAAHQRRSYDVATTLPCRIDDVDSTYAIADAYTVADAYADLPSEAPQAADEEASPDHPEKALVQVEDEVRAAWNAVAAERPGWAQCTKRPSGEVGRMLRARCRDPDWLRDYPEALRRFGAMKWVTKGRFATILRPDSVRKLMDKEWTDDDNKRDLYQPSADWVPP